MARHFRSNKNEIAGALGQILEPLIDLRSRLAAGDEKAIDAAIALLEHAKSSKLPPAGAAGGPKS